MARTKKDGSAPNQTATTTPLMTQYHQVKAKYPDAVLLFRVGDFYETFGEDAIKAARALGITLTSRNNGGVDVELAGFPYHSMDLYLPRLVRAGYRVAICEQMEKPVPGKVVRRAVTEVVTPGVTTDVDPTTQLVLGLATRFSIEADAEAAGAEDVTESGEASEASESSGEAADGDETAEASE